MDLPDDERWRRRKPQEFFFDVPDPSISGYAFNYTNFFMSKSSCKRFLFAAVEDLKVHLGQLKRFPFKELQVATDNFSEINILGRGGLYNVYKGRLADGSLVAIKRMKEERTQDGELQFQMEVVMISMAVHRNLLRLRGFCMTPKERFLVYPYMANGSVASCLRSKGIFIICDNINIVLVYHHSHIAYVFVERQPNEPPLDWYIRKWIALGSARGLSYLHDHSDPKIIHGDVRANNILLDEEFEVVVGDFGLARLMDYDDKHVTTTLRGTMGHIAPEYLATGEATEKADVFGYGIMLLELITGKRAFDPTQNGVDIVLLDWACISRNFLLWL